jgi:hydroxymethylpyrimidine/phosphomethylpyrimidine kinase
VDVFFDGQEFTDLRGVRIRTPHTHGTGCTISAAIAVDAGDAAELARHHQQLAVVIWTTTPTPS